jgi:DMSO/TMAO reductase YedYZ molybdopterin-dependent catalytic subunit
MDNEIGRREVLKKGLALTGFAALATAQWPLPALAKGEDLVPFTDVPDSFKPGPAEPNKTHIFDTRTLGSFYTSNDDHYIVQHYGQPEVDLSTYRLRITGLVDNPMELTLDDIRARSRVELDAGFECGGNSKRILYGLVGNARWGGVSLSTLLNEAKIKPEGKEVVFFGADEGSEKIRNKEVTQNFARSLSVEDALRADNMLALEMNGESLPLYHGKPLRLLVPGWFGVANVKWLTQIHVQDDRYMGRFMGRDYVTLRKYDVGGVERWTEESVTRMNLMSVVARVARTASDHKVWGFSLNDGTPLKAIEVKIDDGPWQKADIDSRVSRYSWKMFTFDWRGAQPGEHTLVSRAIDVEGNVQPTESQVAEKATYWENPGQFPRTVMIS